MNLRDNAEYEEYQAARCTLRSMQKHWRKAQESAGTVELRMYNLSRDGYLLDVDSWTSPDYHDTTD